MGSAGGGLLAAAPIFEEGKKGNTATTNTANTSGVYLNPESKLEGKANTSVESEFDQLSKMLTSGYGQGDIDAATREGRSFADMLQGIVATGGVANAQQRGIAEQFTNDMFKPQQTALDQNFQDEQQRAARLAAQLGRPINDPIIQNKLAQERTRQQGMLDANRSAYQAQEIRQAPFQQLDLQGQLASARGGLATQAMQNRMTLLGLGQNIQANERNWRLQTSSKFNNGVGTQHSGGGLLGGIGAVTGAAGAVAGVAGAFMGMGGAGGGQAGLQGAQQVQGAGNFTPGGMGDYSTLGQQFGAGPVPGGFMSQPSYGPTRAPSLGGGRFMQPMQRRSGSPYEGI